MRGSEPRHSMHQSAADSVAALLRQGEDVFLVPQNLYEYWSVATRPVAQNGLGFSPEHAAADLARFHTDFSVLDELPAVLHLWERLVVQHQVKGKRGHDARLVAAMIVHGIDRLLTFNTADFARYQQIVVISPHDIVGTPPTP